MPGLDTQRECGSRGSRVWTAAVLGLALSCAAACTPALAAPPSSLCALLVPPLDQPRFSGIQLTDAVPPVVAEGGLPAPAPADFRAEVQTRLSEVPFFSGGEWPAVEASVAITEFDSGASGCWLLLVPDILLFPGWWLVGAPVFCFWVEMTATWNATVGEFQRQYAFSLTDYAVVGLYYSGENFPSGAVYLGHTLQAFAAQLAEDYGAFQRGELPARPEPYEDDLDPDDSEWYDALSEGTKTCLGQPVATGAAVVEGAALGAEVGNYVAGADAATRAEAARALGVRAARQILDGTTDGTDIEGVLVEPQYASPDPTVQAAVGEALGHIRCARECAARQSAGESVDCATTCNLPPAP